MGADMNTHITQRSVQAATPPASGYIILFDDKIAGFGCRVTAAGAKSFILNYRVGGEKRRYTIGSWPKWTADAARDEAANVLLPAINKKGADPVRDKKALRDEPKMDALAKEYIEQHAEAKKREKSVYEDKRMLKKIILPKLGQRRVSSVTKREIELLHNSLRNTMKTHYPLAAALDNYRDQKLANALRLLIVTGARPGEVIGAEKAMFDLARGIRTKPSHHTKEKKTEHVPLNNAALLILRRMLESKDGGQVYLFPGRQLSDKKQENPRTTLRNAWRQVCKAAGLATMYYVKGKRGKLLKRWKPNVRVYDLRHTFASHLVSRNWSLQLVGKLLGHTQAATTERYAHVADAALRSVTNDFGEVLTLPEKVA